jgi:hypothetical protein
MNKSTRQAATLQIASHHSNSFLNLKDPNLFRLLQRGSQYAGGDREHYILITSHLPISTLAHKL